MGFAIPSHMYGVSTTDDVESSRESTRTTSNNKVTSPFSDDSYSNPFRLSLMDPFSLEEDPFKNMMYLYSLYSTGNMPKEWQNKIVDRNYNTTINTTIDPKALERLQAVYNPQAGNFLANVAEKTATKMNCKGFCATGITRTLTSSGVTQYSEINGDAYQKADKLAAMNDRFAEIQGLSKDDLDKLPAGCIIVWDKYTDNKGKFHEYGHSTMTLGDGREASDHIIDHIYKPNASFRVFVPKMKLNQQA